jgi:hypothetical protein
MLELSAALIRDLLPNLTADQPEAEGLRSWIESGSFYVGVGPTPDSFVLQDVSLAEFMPYVSYDYERFALASFESLLCCGKEAVSSKAIGWPFAKIYYSAFFGAHAIMRSLGQAVLRLEAAQAARMSRLMSLYVPGLQIGSGTYLARIIQRPAPDLLFDVLLAKISDSGGAHDQFWRSFYGFLAEFTNDVSVNNLPNATSIIGEVSEIQDLLSANGFNAGTWLSAVRNQMTYQHKFGVWYPFQNSPSEAVKQIRRVKVRASSSIRRDYNPKKHPLQAFCNGCHLLAAVNIDLADALSNRGKNKRFSQLWTRLKAS